MTTSRKYNIDAILGWNAPHIHFTAESFAKATEPVEVDEDDYTPYEKFLVSIGQGQQVRYNRTVSR